jgi:hypothetical protein
MTRTIKFRGKRLDTGEWVYGDLVQTCDTCFVVPDRGTTEIDLSDRTEVDPKTVGQFTELLD